MAYEMSGKSRRCRSKCKCKSANRGSDWRNAWKNVQWSRPVKIATVIGNVGRWENSHPACGHWTEVAKRRDFSSSLALSPAPCRS